MRTRSLLIYFYCFVAAHGCPYYQCVLEEDSDAKSLKLGEKLDGLLSKTDAIMEHLGLHDGKAAEPVNFKSGICPREWAGFGDSCYHFRIYGGYYSYTLYNCHEKGGHIAEISSEAENNYIVNMSKLFQTNLWLGGSDLVVRDEWLWVDSWTLISNTTYTNWASGKPDGSGDCLSVNYQTGQWQDDPCDVQNGFVCEMHIEKAMQLLKTQTDCQRY